MNPHKRQKLGPEKTAGDATVNNNIDLPKYRTDELDTLGVPISPPPRKNNLESSCTQAVRDLESHGEGMDESGSDPESSSSAKVKVSAISSPVQLNRIPELNETENIDTTSLGDILGDPLIKECWAFNYLFDVEWLFKHFDEDVRHAIKLVIVHGSWRKESQNKIAIDKAVSNHKNMRAITAYIPDQFGTHHSKMFIIIRHDDTAQVVILTANMLAQDWRMCQAIWRSPLLPLLSKPVGLALNSAPPFGTGERFQFDLRSYLHAYGAKLKELDNSLRHYDFSAVKACLIASIPSRQCLETLEIGTKTLWGWPALNYSIQQIPLLEVSGGHIVAQVSSIATLGVSPGWLYGTLYKALLGKALNDKLHEKNFLVPSNPKLSIVFPTADEIRRTIDGYMCGGSIHIKLQTTANQKQLKYLHPHLCHWASDVNEVARSETTGNHAAGRNRTGPHIKTYLRFSDASMSCLDWGILTSANLSKQAWGSEESPQGEVKISSFEIGVLLWPALWERHNQKAQMVPVFKKDSPNEGQGGEAYVGANTSVIGWRMPYDLPLTHYSENEKPWCATQPHLEPDWMGRVWSPSGS